MTCAPGVLNTRPSASPTAAQRVPPRGDRAGQVGRDEFQVDRGAGQFGTAPVGGPPIRRRYSAQRRPSTLTNPGPATSALSMPSAATNASAKPAGELTRHHAETFAQLQGDIGGVVTVVGVAGRSTTTVSAPARYRGPGRTRRSALSRGEAQRGRQESRVFILLCSGACDGTIDSTCARPLTLPGSPEAADGTLWQPPPGGPPRPRWRFCISPKPRHPPRLPPVAATCGDRHRRASGCRAGVVAHRQLRRRLEGSSGQRFGGGWVRAGLDHYHAQGVEMAEVVIAQGADPAIKKIGDHPGRSDPRDRPDDRVAQPVGSAGREPRRTDDGWVTDRRTPIPAVMTCRRTPVTA